MRRGPPFVGPPVFQTGGHASRTSMWRGLSPCGQSARGRIGGDAGRLSRRLVPWPGGHRGQTGHRGHLALDDQGGRGATPSEAPPFANDLPGPPKISEIFQRHTLRCTRHHGARSEVPPEALGGSLGLIGTARWRRVHARGSGSQRDAMGSTGVGRSSLETIRRAYPSGGLTSPN